MYVLQKKKMVYTIFIVFSKVHTLVRIHKKPACVYILKKALAPFCASFRQSPHQPPCPTFLRRIWNSIECLNAYENDPHRKRQHECVRLIGVWFEFPSPLLMRGKMHKEMKREYEADEKMAMSQP